MSTPCNCLMCDSVTSNYCWIGSSTSKGAVYIVFQEELKGLRSNSTGNHESIAEGGDDADGEDISDDLDDTHAATSRSSLLISSDDVSFHKGVGVDVTATSPIKYFGHL